MEENEEIVSEIPEYSPKSEFSKPLRVSEVIQRCCENRSKEMKEGYYNYKFDKNGNAVKVRIPDSRDVFINSVQALINLLSPEIKRDSTTKEFLEKKNEEIEKLKKIYYYKEIYPEVKNEKVIYKETGRRYLPGEEEKVLSIKVEPIIPPYGEQYLKTTRSLTNWKNKTNMYKEELLIIYDSIFSELNDLIDRLNYFKAGVNF